MAPRSLTEDEMYAALLASDAAYNGRFVTGVLSTGIFCLPSCHARKPKRENVRFFDSFDEARAAGLRACRKCKPEEFERGEDSELETLENALEALRSNPGSFSGVTALAEACGWGTTKLQEFTRRNWHATPADLISDARLQHAQKRLYDAEEPVTEVAFEVGYESPSGFNAAFRERTGTTPSEYRALKASPCFRLHLPEGFNLGPLQDRLARDSDGVIESFDGELARRALHISGIPAVLELRLGGTAEVTVQSERRVPMNEAHAMASRMLGLSQDPRPFENSLERLPRGSALLGRNRGARIPQTPTVFDGVIWALVGQQVTLSFARTLRRRLAESFGEEIQGLRALPKAETLAQLAPEDLLPLQFSRRKAEYLIALAQLSAKFFADLRGQPAARVQATLMSLRGLGVWSTNYLMMRSLGFADCVPLGDTGLASGLRRLYNLDHSPKQPEQAELMQPFTPYRSLVTFHLWQSLKDSA